MDREAERPRGTTLSHRPLRPTMVGVFLPGERRVELREVPIPQPAAGQVLVRMRASAICGSDLRAIYRPTDQGDGPEAYRDVIAGHEPAGHVEAVGPGVQSVHPGDRVAVYHIAGCGMCDDCRGGWMVSCTSPQRAAYGWQRDGGHAPYLLAEERTLVPLPSELSYVEGALAACGLGTAYAALQRLGVSDRDRVLVTGLGPVGIGAALLAKALGAETIGFDPTQARRELAQRLGITVASTGDDLRSALSAMTRGRGFDAAIDCSGSADARLLCLSSARPGGRVAFVGEGGNVTLDVSTLVIHPQLTIIGSWVCSIGQMSELLERMDGWRLGAEEMVTHRFDLSRAAEAYELADRGQVGKVTFVWPEDEEDPA